MLVNGLPRLRANFGKVLASKGHQKAEDLFGLRALSCAVFRKLPTLESTAQQSAPFLKDTSAGRYFTFTLKVLDTGPIREGSLEAVAAFCQRHNSFWDSAIIGADKAARPAYLEALNRTFPVKGLTFSQSGRPEMTASNPLKEFILLRQEGHNVCWPICGLTAVWSFFEQNKQSGWTPQQVKEDSLKQFAVIAWLTRQLRTEIVHPFMNLDLEPRALALANGRGDVIITDETGQELGVSQAGFIDPNSVPEDLELPDFYTDSLFRAQKGVIEAAVGDKFLKRKMILGLVEGPLSIAFKIFGLRNFVKLIPLGSNPGNLPQLVKWVNHLTETIVKKNAVILTQAGADSIAVLEPQASRTLQPAFYEQVMTEPLVSLRTFLNEAGYPEIYHGCGNVSRFFDLFGQIGAQGYSLDTPVSLVEFANKWPEAVVAGNFNPSLFAAFKTPEELIREVRAMREKWASVKYYLPATGCETTALQGARPTDGLNLLEAFVRACDPVG